MAGPVTSFWSSVELSPGMAFFLRKPVVPESSKRLSQNGDIHGPRSDTLTVSKNNGRILELADRFLAFRLFLQISMCSIGIFRLAIYGSKKS